MRLRSLLPALGLLLVACGGATPVATDRALTTATSLALAPPIEVVVDGMLWELPGAACGEVPGAIAAEASTAAAEVERLVAERVSAWPTTTPADPGEAATFFVAVNRVGPTALALALLAGTTADIQTAWSRFEADYAAPDGEPVAVIATRLPGWQATAAAIAAAVPGACG
ncbi:MAG TPA: hypothetical protein DCY40_05385 [Actinobacteria bacterium]|nr:hypothetical protein [Actinomycetota bacterium]